MLVIDFSNTAMQAFGRGVLKGMGAPFVLFGAFDVPQLPQVPQIVPFTGTSAQALSSDWKRVQSDIVKSIRVYAEETA